MSNTKYWELIDGREIDIFTVKTFVTPEDEFLPDIDYQDSEEKAEMIRRLENGSIQHFIVKVVCYLDEVELHTEYLGGCVYERVEDFVDDVYHKDMIDTVLSCAKVNFKKLALKAAKYL